MKKRMRTPNAIDRIKIQSDLVTEEIIFFFVSVTFMDGVDVDVVGLTGRGGFWLEEGGFTTGRGACVF